MSHSLRAKLSGLRYKGILEDKDYKRLCHALDLEKAEQEPCEDVISRQALLDDFGFSEKTRKWGGDHSGYNTMMLYEIQDMIESAPSVNPQEPKWIPVSERLPKESDGIVLVCMPDKFPYNITQHFPNCKVLQRVKMASHSEYTDNWYSSMGGYVDEPLAWMPLPEPYREEGDDNADSD